MNARVLLPFVLLVALAAVAGSVRPAAASGTCSGGYAYAGLVAPRAGAGIEARVMLLISPRVSWGHVGAWVGVGGPGAGPGGSDEWLQVGLSGFSGGQNSLYYEVKAPKVAAAYHEVLPSIRLGEEHTVAVRELARRDWWRVLVDGAPAGRPVFLPGSDGRFHPMAMSESTNDGHPGCNDFRYRFSSIDVARTADGRWRPLANADVLETAACRVLARRRNAFVAASV